MTLKHGFLVDWKASPVVDATDRWREAFPDGGLLHGPQDLADVVWVPVLHRDWLDRVKALVRTGRCSVVVLSPSPNQLEGLSAVNEGARAYSHLYALPALQREVAQVVEHGGFWLGPDLVQRLVAATRVVLERGAAVEASVDTAQLSPREVAVAQAVAQGKSNKEIAAALFISERTVKAHLGHIFEKLGVRDRVQLALRWAQAPTNVH